MVSPGWGFFVRLRKPDRWRTPAINRFLNGAPIFLSADASSSQAKFPIAGHGIQGDLR
jgi:hypothetical protein